jgi:hypothetical protein
MDHIAIQMMALIATKIKAQHAILLLEFHVQNLMA